MINPSKEKVKINTISLQERMHSFNTIEKGYNLEEAQLEASRCLSCPNSPCVQACPIHNSIPKILKAVSEKNIKEAFSIIEEKSVFPMICGAICPHEKQCSGSCTRGKIGDPVNIGAIEQFVARFASSNNLFTYPESINSEKRFAAIGSGPASLAFALTLAKQGYKVRIFEQENEFGGILRLQIPSFRLNKTDLDTYISYMRKLGVEFINNIKVDNNLFDDILKSFDGVFIGTGASKQNILKCDGNNCHGIFQVSDFLKAIHENNTNIYGKNIIVVGGGNAAMDAARTAIRLENVKNVTIIYRRTENEMPACKSELEEAKTEGVVFKTLTNPVKFISQNNNLIKVELAKMELGEKDSSGRRKPIESTEPHIFLDTDCVILALGSNANCEYKNINCDQYGRIITNENNETSIKNVYAGGDIVTGALTVVEAMKSGIKSAKDILKKLSLKQI